MSQIEDPERRVAELEESLARAQKQIGTLEIQVHGLGNPPRPLGTRTPPDKPKGPTLADRAKKGGGKIY